MSCTTLTNSGSICSGVQKMCASLSVIARTRERPASSPDFSSRYIVPSSAMRIGRSRYERIFAL